MTRLRDNAGRRAVGAVLALLIEAGLILVVISIGWTREEPKKPERSLVSMALEPAEDKQPEKAKAQQIQPQAPPAEAPSAPPRVTPVAQPDNVPPAAATPPPIIPIPRDQMAGFDISKLPRQPAPARAPGRGTMGPPNLGVAGDSKRVGTAPGGQPMYAAAWYREPYDDELSGYLSTAQGPGWALIACKTAPDFRVEDCVGLDEYPDGSRIQNAVLAAAWQFRVRPPRIGGVSQVGSWVRIRIDYTERRSR